MSAWVLIMWMGAANGGPAVISGIASESDCETLFLKLRQQEAGFSMLRPFDHHACVSYKEAAQ